jgi:hypothetical protein
MNIMSVMNIIYACDDICDFCEYLRLLEKKKTKKKKKENLFAESKLQCSRRRGRPRSAVCSPSPRAEILALGEGPFFNESQIPGSRRRPRLQREPDIWLSAKTPSSTRARYLALGEGVAPTPDGATRRDGKRAFGESRGRLSAHVRREDPVKLSAKVASPAGCTPCDFRRGFPLGEGFNERERAFAESIPALGEGPESCSAFTTSFP